MKTISFVTPFYNSFRCCALTSMFDLPFGEERVNNITFEEPPSVDDDWQIGLIVGPSGSGKTTVARDQYGANVFQGHVWDERPIFENFAECLTVDEISRAMVSVGLGSIPTWLQPYQTLSNGEKFRCDLARAVAEHESPLLVYDEFTSVVDRTVAKTCSMALKRLYASDAKLKNKKFVALSCHYDIAEYLQPDWILDMQTGAVERRRLRRPPINVAVRRCDKSLWSLFKRFHYLTANINRSVRCYVAFIENKPAAFCATLNSIGRKSYRRISRIVVLPDFQGVGLGSSFASYVAERESALYGLRSFTIALSNYFFAESLLKSKKWMLVSKNISATRSKKNWKSSFHNFGRNIITLRYVSV